MHAAVLEVLNQGQFGARREWKDVAHVFKSMS